MHPQYDETLRQVIDWAREDPRVHAVIVIGSQARSNLPSDESSDLDLMVLVDDPLALMGDTAWFTRFGRPACFFEEVVPLHFTTWDWRIRRVLYSDHREIDFSLLPFHQQDEVLAVNKDIISKGWRVAYDAAGRLEETICALLSDGAAEPAHMPSPEKLQAVVSELLYHVIWAYKKIRRQELWVAMSCINCHMKELLLRLIEAHTASVCGRPNPLGYSGRFLELRMAPTIRERLAGCFTRYDPREAAAALQNILDLTRSLYEEVCLHDGYEFDAAQFERIQAMYDELRQKEV